MIIWILTWNCENQAPDNIMLMRLKNILFPPALAAAQYPDLLVVALQEAKPATKGDLASFVSHRLAAASALGAAPYNYRHIASASVAGSTKLTGGTCHIQLGVLARGGTTLDVQSDPTRNSTKTQLDAVRQTSIGRGQRLLVDQGASQYKSGSFGCKGGAYARVYYEGRQLGFVGAHLTGPHSSKTNEQIRKLLHSLTGGTVADNATSINAALNQQFDVVFFMGDLNYRLATTGMANLNVTTMVNNLRDRVNRQALWQNDTLPQSPLVGTYTFQFPVLDQDALPTYKRYYQDRSATNPCARLAYHISPTAPPLPAPGDYSPHTALLQDCYFHGKAGTALVRSEKRQGYFEVGWLDRIGYKVSTTAAPAVVINGAPQMITLEEFVLSDHTPVLMKIDLT